MPAASSLSRVEIRSALSSSPGRADRPGGRVLEPGPVEVVLLELLGDAPPREAGVAGATGDVPLVVAQQLGEIITLHLRDEVAGQVGQGALDVDQVARPPPARPVPLRGGRSWRGGRRGG